MIPEERKERITQLRRKEDRKKRLPELLAGLSTATGNTITEEQVLTLEQIDVFQTHVNSADFEFNFLNVSFTKNEVQKLSNLLLELKDELAQENYLRLHHYAEIAVLNLDTTCVLHNWGEILQLDGDTICVFDHRFKNGFWIDLHQEYWYEKDPAGRIGIYELRIFGKEWIRKVAAKL